MDKGITNACSARNAKTGSLRLVFVRLLGTCMLAVLCATPQGAAAERVEEGEWTFIGMFGYDFTLIRLPSTVTLGVRGFGQDYKDGSGSSKFAWDVTQWGPILSLAMHF